MPVTVTRLPAPSAIVGEGPLWSVAEQALYFTDVRGQRIWRFDPAKEAAIGWLMPRRVTALAFRAAGGAAVALADGVHGLDFASGALTPLSRLADAGAGAGEVANDAKVDHAGRFFVATLDGGFFTTGEAKPVAGLYRLEPGAALRKVAGDISVGNGPCWSPDGGTFYLSDSHARAIHAFDYDLASGALGERRPFAAVEVGRPDGMTADRDGLLWSAASGAGQIVCFRPDGRVERVVKMPVLRPTSVAFGGQDLDRLFVTTHSGAVDGGPRAPGAGDLYVVDGLGAKGLAEPFYLG